MTASTLTAPTRSASSPVDELLAFGLSNRRWHDIDSSAIARIAYDRSTGSLYVEFNRSYDRLYIFHGVTRGTYDKLMRAESVGAYFAREIKGFYDFTRVGVVFDVQQGS